jgi:hypothetical protein
LFEIADEVFLEDDEGLLANLSKNGLDIDVRVSIAFELRGDQRLVALLGLFVGALLLELADIGPGRLDHGDLPVVQGCNIGKRQLHQHRAVKGMPVQGLRARLSEHFVLQFRHLLQELLSQVFVWELNKGLQVLFLFSGSHKGAAIPLREEVSQEASHSVFGLSSLRAATLLPKSRFQILLRGHRGPVKIHQLQGEVSQHPKKLWKHAGQ